MLALDEDLPAQNVPRADDGPTADFPGGYEDDGDNAAEHNPVNITDVIGEDR